MELKAKLVFARLLMYWIALNSCNRRKRKKERERERKREREKERKREREKERKREREKERRGR